jgi:transposase
MKKHIVCLDHQAREGLRQLAHSGIRPAQVVRRCLILLKSDEGSTDEEIAEHVSCTTRTVRTIRKRFCEAGVEHALCDSPRCGRPEQFTERQRQQVVALACTDPPAGRVRWTLELLCEHAVKEGFVDTVSVTEVSLWLKEHDLKPWRKKLGACPN